MPSGRPLDGELAAYAKADIDYVAGDDAVAILARQERETIALLKPVGDARASGLSYAPGKWTLKEIIGHLADDERIFAYRMLCVARGEPAPLPGFDENLYVSTAGFEARPLDDLLDEYSVVRRSTIVLLQALPPGAWLCTGIVNGYTASVRGLAFHIAGHELHHLRVVREKYLRG